MKRFLTIFFIIKITISQAQEKLCKAVLENTKLDKNIVMSGVTVFLISSYDCGYCVRDIPFYNKIFKEYGKEITFIALMEDDLEQIKKFEKTNKEILNWQKVPKSLSIFDPFWKQQLFPQIHFYYKGKLKKILLDASDRTKNQIVHQLNNFILREKNITN